jgi:hypothetical protein
MTRYLQYNIALTCIYVLSECQETYKLYFNYLRKSSGIYILCNTKKKFLLRIDIYTVMLICHKNVVSPPNYSYIYI